MRLVSGWQDTRCNEEDFIITPCLFAVYLNKRIKLFGLGLCWGYWAIYLAYGKNIPKGFPFFSCANKIKK